MIADGDSAPALRAALDVPVYVVDGTTITGAERDQLGVGLLAGRGAQGRAVVDRVRAALSRTRAAHRTVSRRSSLPRPGRLRAARRARLTADRRSRRLVGDPPPRPASLKPPHPGLPVRAGPAAPHPQTYEISPRRRICPPPGAGRVVTIPLWWVSTDGPRLADAVSTWPSRAAPTARHRPVTGSDRRYDALLLDAFGTLITVDAPAQRLAQAVAERLGIDVSSTTPSAPSPPRSPTTPIAATSAAIPRASPRCTTSARRSCSRSWAIDLEPPPRGRAAGPRDPLPRLRRHRAAACAARPRRAAGRDRVQRRLHAARDAGPGRALRSTHTCSARRPPAPASPTPASSGGARGASMCPRARPARGRHARHRRGGRPRAGIDVRIIDRDGATPAEARYHRLADRDPGADR